MGALIQFKDSAVLLEFPRTVQSLRGTLSSALKRHRLPELLIENLIREAEIQADATPEEALAWGLSVIGHIRKEAERLGYVHGMKLLLEQTPAETTAYRFARLDLKQFSPLPGRYVRGDLAGGEIYYTNSTHLHPAAPVDPLTGEPVGT